MTEVYDQAQGLIARARSSSKVTVSMFLTMPGSVRIIEPKSDMAFSVFTQQGSVSYTRDTADGVNIITYEQADALLTEWIGTDDTQHPVDSEVPPDDGEAVAAPGEVEQREHGEE